MTIDGDPGVGRRGGASADRGEWPEELRSLGIHLTSARITAGLTQKQLAQRSGLVQTQISHFENARRLPDLPQIVRLAKALNSPLQRLLSGTNQPAGFQLRDVALELAGYGLVDVWVEDPLVPGASRRFEEVIALCAMGDAPDARIIEALPALLSRNRWNPRLLKAYGQADSPRTSRRIAWLADITLALSRYHGLPWTPDRSALSKLLAIVPKPGPDVPWDDLGHPTDDPPKSPLWTRWKIRYGMTLDDFRRRALHLADCLRQGDKASGGVR